MYYLCMWVPKGHISTEQDKCTCPSTAKTRSLARMASFWVSEKKWFFQILIHGYCFTHRYIPLSSSCAKKMFFYPRLNMYFHFLLWWNITYLHFWHASFKILFIENANTLSTQDVWYNLKIPNEKKCIIVH